MMNQGQGGNPTIDLNQMLSNFGGFFRPPVNAFQTSNYTNLVNPANQPGSGPQNMPMPASF